MVDFQSRETHRGLDEEDEEDEGDDGDDHPADGDGESPESVTDPATDEQLAVDPDGDAAVAVLAASGASTDASDAAADALESAGYVVRARGRRAQNLDAIQAAVDEYVERGNVCAVVTVGGTGVGPGDRTIEAVHPLFDKELPGFGEAFRRQWGARTDEATFASRAAGGIADDTPVFCLPADPEAVTFAVRELVAPEAAAIHREATGD